MRNIHASAVLSKNVELGENIYIGPNCIIGFPGFQFYDDDNEYRHTTIESNTIVMGNSVICLGTLIGGYSRIDYHSFVGEQSRVGRYCVIEYGARIYDNVNLYPTHWVGLFELISRINF